MLTLQFWLLWLAEVIAAVGVVTLAHRWGPLRPGSRWWQTLLFLIGLGVSFNLIGVVLGDGLQGLSAHGIYLAVVLGLSGVLGGTVWWLLLATDSRRRLR
jgi:hypothetical protein